MLSKRPCLRMGCQPLAGGMEQFGIGAPETVDGLFFIPDEKHAAASFGVAGRHFFHQRQQ